VGWIELGVVRGSPGLAAYFFIYKDNRKEYVEGIFGLFGNSVLLLCITYE